MFLFEKIWNLSEKKFLCSNLERNLWYFMQIFYERWRLYFKKREKTRKKKVRISKRTLQIQKHFLLHSFNFLVSIQVLNKKHFGVILDLRWRAKFFVKSFFEDWAGKDILKYSSFKKQGKNWSYKNNLDKRFNWFLTLSFDRKDLIEGGVFGDEVVVLFVRLFKGVKRVVISSWRIGESNSANFA